MPNYNGTPGNRNGGRKSAYQERADAKMLWDMFFDEHDVNTIREKFKTGKYSIKEIFVSKAFAGNEKFILAMFNKIFPNETIFSGNPNAPISLEVLQQRIGGMPDEMLADIASGKVIEGEFEEKKPQANGQPTTTIEPASPATVPAGPGSTAGAEVAPDGSTASEPAPAPDSGNAGTSTPGAVTPTSA